MSKDISRREMIKLGLGLTALAGTALSGCATLRGGRRDLVEEGPYADKLPQDLGMPWAICLNRRHQLPLVIRHPYLKILENKKGEDKAVEITFFNKEQIKLPISKCIVMKGNDAILERLLPKALKYRGWLKPHKKGERPYEEYSEPEDARNLSKDITHVLQIKGKNGYELYFLNKPIKDLGDRCEVRFRDGTKKRFSISDENWKIIKTGEDWHLRLGIRTGYFHTPEEVGEAKRILSTKQRRLEEDHCPILPRVESRSLASRIKGALKERIL